MCKHYSNFDFFNFFLCMETFWLPKFLFNLKASPLINDSFTYTCIAKNRHVISSTNTTKYTTSTVIINIREITVNIIYNSRRVVNNSCRYTNEFLIAVYLNWHCTLDIRLIQSLVKVDLHCNSFFVLIL